jgi:hypothetical protein
VASGRWPVVSWSGRFFRGQISKNARFLGFGCSVLDRLLVGDGSSGQWQQVEFLGGFGVVGLLPCSKTREIFGGSVGGVEPIGEFFGKTGFLWWEYFPD